mmetsp:Transcript_13382/g.38538  ORF Transcript_13382/g.38538 Transcript_13382/m.38538 type:complete len:248 (+) Transcript_13382:483-1226(+)
MAAASSLAAARSSCSSSLTFSVALATCRRSSRRASFLSSKLPAGSGCRTVLAGVDTTGRRRRGDDALLGVASNSAAPPAAPAAALRAGRCWPSARASCGDPRQGTGADSSDKPSVTAGALDGLKGVSFSPGRPAAPRLAASDAGGTAPATLLRASPCCVEPRRTAPDVAARRFPEGATPCGSSLRSASDSTSPPRRRVAGGDGLRAGSGTPSVTSVLLCRRRVPLCFRDAPSGSPTLPALLLSAARP